MSKYIASAAWVGARLLGQGLEFVAWVILTQKFGARGIGLLAAALFIARLLGLIADWGATIRGPRDVVAHGRNSPLVVALVRRRERVGLVLGVAMAAAAVIFGAAHIAPFGLVVMARGANRDWIALGENQQIRSATPLLIQGLLLVGGVSFMSSVDHAAIMFAIASVVAVVASTALNPVDRSTPDHTPEVDAWYLINAIGDQVLMSADTVLLLFLVSETAAGIYASVYRLPLAWISIVGLAVAAAIPFTTRDAQRVDFDPGVAHRKADRISLGLCVALLPFAVAGVAVVERLFGSEFGEGRVPLAILFAGIAVTSVSAPHRAIYAATASDRSVGLATAGAAVANIVLNLAAIPLWGMAGAAITTLLTQLVILGFFARWSYAARAGSIDGEEAIADSRMSEKLSN